MKSLHRYEELENSNFNKSLNLQMNSTGSSSKNEISAFIDTENRYSVADKLSQVNTLIQMENIASYSFVSDCIEKGEAQVHAFWYDISSGEILFFSKNQKHFVPINEQNVDLLIRELQNSETDPNNLLQEAENAKDELRSKEKCC